MSNNETIEANRYLLVLNCTLVIYLANELARRKDTST